MGCSLFLKLLDNVRFKKSKQLLSHHYVKLLASKEQLKQAEFFGKTEPVDFIDIAQLYKLPTILLKIAQIA